MTDEERELTPDAELSPSQADLNDDSLPIADPVENLIASQAEELLIPVADYSLPVTVTDGLDIEAALAAVSSLSDVMAEQEAAEQARLARIEADRQAKAERQARLDNPELFFPVPPMTTLKRGQLASLLPAALLIAIGAWLTFTLTTVGSLPDGGLLMAVIVGGVGLTLVVRWLASGRWAGGSLFFGLALLLMTSVIFFLLQPASPDLAAGWPLLIAAVGLSMLLSGILAYPSNRQLVFPGVVLVAAGLAGLVITMNLLSSDMITLAASLWPLALVIIAVLFVVPVLFRQRQ